MNRWSIDSGIEDELFGVLLGLWVGYVTVDINLDGNGNILTISTPWLYLLYLFVLLGFIVGLLKISFTLAGIGDRWIYYFGILLSAWFGLTGLTAFNPNLSKGGTSYLGLLIVLLWILTAELTSYVMNRSTTHRPRRRGS